jgi:Na+/proline symporter
MFKKIIDFLKNWFQKNGLIKILVAFVLLIISVLVVKNSTGAFGSIFNVVGLISFGYLILTVLIFTIVGIVNAIRDK